MSAENSELLTRAMESQIPAVISTGEGTARRDMMVQFTSTIKETNAAGFWTRLHEGDGRLIDQLIKSAQPVTVSFNTQGAKVNLQCSLLKKRRHNLMQKLLLLSWPQSIQAVEQRHKPRVWVPQRYRIGARLVVISPGGNEVGQTPVRVWDIGMEGASLICPTAPFILSMSKDSSVKVMLRPPDSEKEHTFAGTHRYMIHLTDERVRMGVQFVASQDPFAGAAQRALRGMVDELDAVCGRNDMLGALRKGILKTETIPAVRR